MATALYMFGEVTYFTHDDIDTVVRKIDNHEQIEIWWFQSHGVRCKELMYIPDMDRVRYLRTESDD